MRKTAQDVTGKRDMPTPAHHRAWNRQQPFRYLRAYEVSRFSIKESVRLGSRDGRIDARLSFSET
jgi:hypothetical protein